MATRKKAVAKRAETNIVDTSMYEDDADQGFEEADGQSYAIPFMTILQSGSPQVKKSDGAYIAGAEEGNIFNTVSEETMDGAEGVMVVPVHYRRVFLEWTPRDSGGGLVAEHSAAEGIELLQQCTKDEKKHDILPNGNQLADTRMHYVLVGHDDGTIEGTVLSMGSSQIKRSRKWMTMMQKIKMTRADGTLYTPPMYSQMYRMTTVPDSNDQGSWFSWKITHEGINDQQALYSQAKMFREAILAGEAKAQPVQEEGGGEEEF